MIDTRAIRMRWEADGSKRDERGQRLFAASEARAAGWGGVAAVANITGVSRKRIIAGLKDLAAPPLDPGRVRRRGGGRRPITETDGTIVEDLKHPVEPVTMGDPMRPLMWVSKSQEKLARAACQPSINRSPACYIATLLKMSLRRVRFSGRTGIADYCSSPGFAGTPVRPPGADLCFLGLVVSLGHEPARPAPLSS